MKQQTPRLEPDNGQHGGKETNGSGPPVNAEKSDTA